MTPLDAHALLKQYDLRPSKGLGQNFLVNPNALASIVAAAELTPDDTVLEIGAGLGTLTERLAQAAGHVVAVELDERLMGVLHDTLSGSSNVEIVQGDILELDPASLVAPAAQYAVVANLPYYITSAVLRHLLEARARPRRMVVTVQREVAERIVAQPGEMSMLSVSVQFYGRPHVLFRIKPGSFYPSPDVESAVVRVDTHDTPPVDVEDVDAFFRVVKAGFAQRRKQLRNTLAGGLHLPPEEVEARLQKVSIDPKRRAQALSLEEWAKVARALAPSLLGGGTVPPP
ncbi:MAG: 16S rRNA (adenine(1518)-N(6)/adenine(1519)-N(6))-dimethyltransferase RsmA [Anaerolineae bacterium]|nr:16S rRNA (adenine(1518)-N(6)/adenine(1519)-N(6))-dimethyltransferase RsmA [Anaerolineae bacterium]